MKDYKKILEGIVNIINTTEKSDIGFANICSYIGENCPELKESEDERIRKEIIAWLKNSEGQTLPIDRYNAALAWLEKQGEQKVSYTTIVETGNGGINALVTREITNGCDDEQKPFDYENADIQQKDFAPKVEPKFKVGDWLVHNERKRIIKIVNHTPFDCEVVDILGYHHTITNDAIENNYHLWTIQDAKDGDILASNKSIFIFQEEYIGEKPIAYCGLMNGLFIEGNDACWTNEKCYPATKEQHDLLFQKMHEAGYEWDAEKRELRKIDARKNLTLDGDLMQADCMIVEQNSADTVEPKCEESKTKVFDAPTPFEDKLYAFVAACELLTLPSKIEFIKEHSQELLDAAKEQAEKKHEEDMELIKGLLEELNKKTFKPPFDIKTFPESKPSEPFKPFDPWGQVCLYACPTAPYDPNITISTTDTLNEDKT